MKLTLQKFWQLIQPKVRSAIYGLILLIVFSSLGISIGFLLIEPTEYGPNAILFVVWWIILSTLIEKRYLFKKHRVKIGKVFGLTGFLIFTLLIDSFQKIPDNPITIFLITLFGIGALHLLAPAFFDKYKKYIFGVYLLVFLNFTYGRIFSDSFDYYSEHKKGTSLSFFLLPIPVFIGLLILEQWRWLKSLQTAKTTAELALLKSQINPHFFFNTLNNLYGLTVEKSDDAPAVVLKLSDMMRYTIYEGQKKTVSLKSEADYLESYIQLHQIRYNQQVDINFKQSIDADRQIAPLLYIILLENAIKHGVESLIQDAFVSLSLTSDPEIITFKIENNYDHIESHSAQGIGLKNLKRRLDLIYPDQYQLTFNITDSLYQSTLIINQA